MSKLYKLLSLGMISVMLLGGCRSQDMRAAATLPATPVTREQELRATETLPIAPRTEAPGVTPTGTITLKSGLSSGLTNLEFDKFIELSYQRWLSRDPETMLELGLSRVYHLPTDQLTNISDEYIRQTQDLESDILHILGAYDRTSLSPAQQLTYDIYKWYLEDKVDGQAFMYDDYPINPTVFSVHLDLLQWFTDLFPVTNFKEAQDYITCLSQVDTKFSQLIDGLQRREDSGVILPYFLLDYLIGELNLIANASARETPYYTALESKLEPIAALSTSERQELLVSAEQAINDSVLPAYQSLVGYLEHLLTVATNDAGVWKFPNGDAYYSYVLKHYTSTELTADEIHALGLQALDRIHAEMRLIFEQLGYPQDESIPQSFNRVTADGGIAYGDEIVQGYEDILTAIQPQVDNAFDLRPSIGVIVVGGPTGGYYIAPAVDGSRPGMFYAQNTGYVARYSMPTLAYHEAIPGHHTQIAIAQQLDLPSFRRGADFVAFAEGWALYAEHLVFDLGVYADDPYGNLGRLQAEAFRAARLVVDTGLHAKKWTFSQALNFMVENTGMPESTLRGEVSRYISMPGQATAYYIGYTRIMELRQKAMDELGDQFDLKAFHDLLLGNAAMPLDILERVVDDYIRSKVGGG